MSQSDPTYVGTVESVNGSVITVRIKDAIPTLVMVEGQSYRIGQVGAFLRIPLGYTQLYSVCTLVGAAAAPQAEMASGAHSQRWLSASLFGESVGDAFERGVSQYPTFGDEVHLVTQQDIKVIYSTNLDNTITVGHIASSSGIPGRLDLGKFVSRHSAVVGSTGSGKSNFVAVLLEAIASETFLSSRVIVIDPHGEYGEAAGDYGYTFKVNPESKNDKPLLVPFWALPFDELKAITLGDMQPATEAVIRDEISDRKKLSATTSKIALPETVITSDSPIPFSLKKLWFDLDDFERQTFKQNGGKDKCAPEKEGNAENLEPNIYPKPSLGAAAPFANPSPRRISKQLDLLRSRLQDSRFDFLFSPGTEYTPSENGVVLKDLDSLVASWVGHNKPITVLDVSGLPSEILSMVVGTLLRIIYDMLFWAAELPVGGRKQPLLVVLDEAHLFIPDKEDSAAHRIIGKIAKEGRKYGVGLCVVTQRPTEIDATALSQCGTMISLRLTNSSDRNRVQSTMPDDLGVLSGLLPSLRTGEGLVIGEAMPIPSRIQFFKAGRKRLSEDPVSKAWLSPRPDETCYTEALDSWRRQSIKPKED